MPGYHAEPAGPVALVTSAAVVYALSSVVPLADAFQNLSEGYVAETLVVEQALDGPSRGLVAWGRPAQVFPDLEAYPLP